VRSVGSYLSVLVPGHVATFLRTQITFSPWLLEASVFQPTLCSCERSRKLTWISGCLDDVRTDITRSRRFFKPSTGTTRSYWNPPASSNSQRQALLKTKRTWSCVPFARTSGLQASRQRFEFMLRRTFQSDAALVAAVRTLQPHL